MGKENKAEVVEMAARRKQEVMQAKDIANPFTDLLFSRDREIVPGFTAYNKHTGEQKAYRTRIQSSSYLHQRFLEKSLAGHFGDTFKVFYGSFDITRLLNDTSTATIWKTRIREGAESKIEGKRSEVQLVTSNKHVGLLDYLFLGLPLVVNRAKVVFQKQADLTLPLRNKESGKDDRNPKKIILKAKQYSGAEKSVALLKTTLFFLFVTLPVAIVWSATKAIKFLAASLLTILVSPAVLLTVIGLKMERFVKSLFHNPIVGKAVQDGKVVEAYAQVEENVTYLKGKVPQATDVTVNEGKEDKKKKTKSSSGMESNSKQEIAPSPPARSLQEDQIKATLYSPGMLGLRALGKALLITEQQVNRDITEANQVLGDYYDGQKIPARTVDAINPATRFEVKFVGEQPSLRITKTVTAGPKESDTISPHVRVDVNATTNNPSVILRHMQVEGLPRVITVVDQEKGKESLKLMGNYLLVEKLGEEKDKKVTKEALRTTVDTKFDAFFSKLDTAVTKHRAAIADARPGLLSSLGGFFTSSSKTNSGKKIIPDLEMPENEGQAPERVTITG